MLKCFEKNDSYKTNIIYFCNQNWYILVKLNYLKLKGKFDEPSF